MRTARAVVSILSLVLPGAATAGPDAAIRPERAMRLVERLGVNAANVDREVADGKCEHQGVAEIADLLVLSSIEEMWAFLPRGQPSSSCQWHEIGRNEKTDTDEAFVDVDWAYLEALIAKNSAVYLYHFHPLVFFDYARSSLPDSGIDSSRRTFANDLRFSMPSPSDIHFMMEITSRFYYRYPGGGDIRNRVVTPYGVIDYALTEAGRLKYESDKDARTQGLYIKYVAASALGDESIEAIVDAHPDDIPQAMERLVDVLNTKFLRVELSPIADH